MLHRIANGNTCKRNEFSSEIECKYFTESLNFNTTPPAPVVTNNNGCHKVLMWVILAIFKRVLLPVGSMYLELVAVAELDVVEAAAAAVAVELDMLCTNCCCLVRLVVVVVAILTVVWSSYLYPLDHYFDCSQIVVGQLKIARKTIHSIREFREWGKFSYLSKIFSKMRNIVIRLQCVWWYASCFFLF